MALVLVSNRGPVSFRRDDDGSLVARRGAGGLVSGLGPLVAGTDAVWLAAAMSEADREAAGAEVTEVEGFRFRALAVEAETYRRYYDEIANTTLWYLHHGLGDRARQPTFDRGWWAAWDAYVEVNRAFAEVVAEVAPPDAVVLVQDLHLYLVATELAERRPDLAAVHFSHTPWAAPDAFAVLPEPVRTAILDGMAAHRGCGFHSARWEQRFRGCGGRGHTFVSPLGPDPDDITAVAPAAPPEVGDRKVITRVDRIELSKNIVRGFLAYEELLDRRPEWREQVVFAALGYPSREGVADYVAYRREVEAVVTRVNERFGTDGWTPILYDDVDHFPSSVAALRRADVVLVNPVSDGMNLVAKEAALVNERDGVLVLSPMAGAWDELADVAVACDPYDVSQTADALDRALRLDDRAERFGRWRAAVTARTPEHWLADNLAAAGQPASG